MVILLQDAEPRPNLCRALGEHAESRCSHLRYFIGYEGKGIIDVLVCSLLVKVGEWRLMEVKGKHVKNKA